MPEDETIEASTLEPANDSERSQGDPADPQIADLTGDSDLIDLPSGDYLDVVSSSAITTASRTRVIVIAGGEECGKTTLLASIYEKFQEGPFGGLLFAGSRTLPGFEARCHLARIVSDRARPETERTKARLEDMLLHLRLRADASDADPYDLLFTDLAGERFRLARDSTEECKKLRIIRRADHFVLMLDGERLSTIEQREEAYTDGRSLLRSCLDATMLGKDSLVDVLVSKSDIIKSRAEDADLQAFIESVRSEMKREFATRVGRLRFFDVAARPESPVLPFAHNLDKCFPSWVSDYARRSYASPPPQFSTPSSREIDRFLSATMGENLTE